MRTMRRCEYVKIAGQSRPGREQAGIKALTGNELGR